MLTVIYNGQILRRLRFHHDASWDSYIFRSAQNIVQIIRYKISSAMAIISELHNRDVDGSRYASNTWKVFRLDLRSCTLIHE
jgi:hypothetical protein